MIQIQVPTIANSLFFSDFTVGFSSLEPSEHFNWKSAVSSVDSSPVGPVSNYVEEENAGKKYEEKRRERELQGLF